MNKQKKILIFITFFAASFLFGSKTELKLKLAGYNPENQNNFIHITVENRISPVKKQIHLSDSGTINYFLIIDKKKEILIEYDEKKFSLFISPAEKLDVVLNISDLLYANYGNPRFTDFSISGSNKITNSLILQNSFFINSLIKEATSVFEAEKSLKDMKYQALRLSEMKKQLQSLDAFLSKNNISDTAFINWCKAQIKYKTANDLIIFPFYGKTNTKINESDPYFDFIYGINPEKEDNITYHCYLEYLSTLTTSYKIIANISEKHDAQREKLETKFPIKFDIIKNFPYPKEREIMLAFLFKDNDEILAGYSDSLKIYVSEELIQLLSIKSVGQTSSIMALISNFPISDKEKSELIKLYQDTKGKVVFHDFWTSHCPPCLQEFPNYNALMDFAGDSVVFIFLGSGMERSEWKKTRLKYKLQGTHYLLSDNQLEFYIRYFGISSYPDHHILDTYGKLVTENIPPVKPSNFSEIKKVLFKHYHN